MIVWDEASLEQVHIGRGQIPPMPPGKKLSPSKVATDAMAMLLIRQHNTTAVPTRIDAAGTEALTALGERALLKGKGAANHPLEPASAGLAYQLACRRPSWRAERPQTLKLVRDWLINGGPALALRAVVASWYWDHTCTWNYGSDMAVDVSLTLRDTPSWVGITDDEYRRTTTDAVEGWRELRRLLAYADDETYAVAVTTMRELWPDQSPELQALLAYLCPTEQDLAEELFERTRPQDGFPTRWLAWALSDTHHAARLARALNRSNGWWPVLATGDVDAIVAEIGDGILYFARQIAVFIDSPTLATMFAASDHEESTPFFLRFPHHAVAALPADSPILAAVLRAHPQLDKDAPPTASDEEVPSLLQADNTRSKKRLPKEWSAYTHLFLAGRDKALSPAQVARLGKALMLSNGKMTPELQAVHEALDPQSRGEFGLALYEVWAGNTYGCPKWLFRALCVLHSDAVVDRVSADIASMNYQSGITALEILASIGTERTLLRVAHIAAKGRGRGLKNAAERWLGTIARQQGLTKDQLADRLVPDLGMESGPVVLDLGPRQFTVGFDEALKPYLIDASGKTRKSLPKAKSDDPDKTAAAKTRWTALKKAARTVASIQLSRLEQAMVNGRTWSAEEFERYLTRHPLLRHLVGRLVWAVKTDHGLVTFRVDGEETSDRFDESLTLPEGDICLPHALHITDELGDWGEVLGDYELVQPFEQIGRTLYRPDSAEAQEVIDRIHGGRAKGGTIAGLTGRGWERGGVEDAGQWYEAWFHRPGVEIELTMDHGVNVAGAYGYDETQNLKLKVTVGEGGALGFSEAIRQLASLNLVD